MSSRPFGAKVPVSPIRRSALMDSTFFVRWLLRFLKLVSSSMTSMSKCLPVNSPTLSRLATFTGASLSASCLFLVVTSTMLARSCHNSHFSASCIHTVSATRLGATISAVACGYSRRV